MSSATLAGDPGAQKETRGGGGERMGACEEADSAVAVERRAGWREEIDRRGQDRVRVKHAQGRGVSCCGFAVLRSTRLL